MRTLCEIKPANGGKDAEAFAEELATAITNHLTKTRTPHKLTPASGAQKSWVITLPGNHTKHLNWLTGTHVVTRIPKGSTKRHTSSANIIVHTTNTTTAEPLWSEHDITIDRYRGRGAGGQRKNKVETAIRLTHKPTGTVITRETGRSQFENIESAKQQLTHALTAMRERQQQHATRDAKHVDAGRAFTHNYQQGLVTNHTNGSTVTIKDWAKGNLKK